MTDANGNDTDRRLTLDDLHIGQRFTSGTHALDAGAIIAFATEFDPQPFHLDDGAARDTLFGGLVSSGWHTASVTMKLLVAGGLPIAGGIIGAGGEIHWPQPTRAGDVLRVETEVVAIKPSLSNPHRGTVTVRSETRNQRNEVVQTLMARLIVPRRERTGHEGPPLTEASRP